MDLESKEENQEIQTMNPLKPFLLICFFLNCHPNLFSQIGVTLTVSRSLITDTSGVYSDCPTRTKVSHYDQSGVSGSNWIAYIGDSCGTTLCSFVEITVDSMNLDTNSNLTLTIDNEQLITSLEKDDYFIGKFMRFDFNRSGNDAVSFYQQCRLTYPDFNLELKSSSLSSDTVLTGKGNKQLTIETSVINKGSEKTPNYNLSYFFSKDTVFDLVKNSLERDQDVLIEEKIHSSIGTEDYKSNMTYEVPIGTAANRWYYIFTVLDPRQLLDDPDNGTEIIMDSVYVTERQSDIELTNLTIQNGAAAAGDLESILLSVTTKNADPYVIPGHELSIYLSQDLTLDNQDVPIEQYKILYGLTDSIKTTTYSTHVPLETNAGSYYLIVKADGNNRFKELNENNNTFTIPITINNGFFGIEIIDMNVQGVVSKGEEVEVSVNIKNTGNVVWEGWDPPQVFFSKDTIFDYACDFTMYDVLDKPMQAPKPRETDTYKGKFTFYDHLSSGDYHVFVRVKTSDDPLVSPSVIQKKITYNGVNNANEIKIPIAEQCVKKIVSCQDTIYDTGGKAYDMLPQSKGSLLLLPDQENQQVVLNFLAFDLLKNIQSSTSRLHIYDGTDDQADLIGSYLSTSPGEVRATNEKGALFIKSDFDNPLYKLIAFHSSGFEAALTCASTTSVSRLSNNSPYLFPNPTDGTTTIKNYEGSWFLFNMSGRQIMKGSGKTIQLNTLASGVYFLHTDQKVLKIIKH